MRQPRRGRKGRGGMIRNPDDIERGYASKLTGLVADFRDYVRSELIMALEIAAMTRASQVRADSWVETIESAIARIRLAISPSVRDLEREAIRVGREISDFNSVEWQSIVRQTVGVDAFRGEPWLQDELRSFAAENAALIKSLPDQALTQIEGIAQRGIRNGISAAVLEDEIMQHVDGVRSRARLIARDQTSKLNGQLTEMRQRSIGIKTYYWDSSNDERVRPSHAALDGKLCKWDDDTVYSTDNGQTWRKRSSIGAYIGHPGSDIQCRCGARSNSDALLDELGI